MCSVNECKDYEKITLLESLSLLGSKHSSHCMLYTKDNETGISFGLLQIRFDGLIGFAGGEVDVQTVAVDHIIEATNRELFEEIDYQFENVTQNDWICSHRKINSQFFYHFFAKQLSYDQFLHLESTHTNAQHFPIESLGLFRVPIGGTDPKSSQKFLYNFLRQKFAGNARQQFIETVTKLSLLSIDDQKLIQTNDFIDDKVSNTSKGIEVKALLTTEVTAHYHKETVDVIYGLMTIRSDGLFDFVGTDFIDKLDNNSMISALYKSLEKDLGLNSSVIDLESNAIKMSFDDNTSHIFSVYLNSSQFTKIETNFINSENFNTNTFGLFRIPLKFRGQLSEFNHYVRRFVSNFFNQRFENNAKTHLISIFDKFLDKN